jgi:hypothetical protein
MLAEQGAAPAGVAKRRSRTRATPGLRPGSLGTPARSLADGWPLWLARGSMGLWPPKRGLSPELKARRAATEKRGPAPNERRDGAPRGAHQSQRVPTPQGVETKRMRFIGAPSPRFARGEKRKTGLPGAAKNTGDFVCPYENISSNRCAVKATCLALPFHPPHV